MMELLVYSVLGYLFLVFVVLRLVVPNLGFRKSALLNKLPSGLDDIMSELRAESMWKEDVLWRSYIYVTSKYHGGRMATVAKFWLAFADPLTQGAGFMHCTSQNYLLRTLLVKSGKFTEDDIRVSTVPYNIFIHQYLEVRIHEQWIFVDPWSTFLGVPFGKRSIYV